MEDKLHSLQTEFDSTFNPRRLPEQELDIFYPLDIDEQQKFNPPSLVHGRNLDTLKHKTRNANLPTNLPHFLHNIDLELKHISEKVRKLRFNSKMQIAKPRMKHGHNEQNFWIHHPRITLRKEDYNLYKLALRNDAEDSHALYYYLDYFSKLRYATPTFAIVASTAELKTLPDPDDEKLRSLLDAMAIERTIIERRNRLLNRQADDVIRQGVHDLANGFVTSHQLYQLRYDNSKKAQRKLVDEMTEVQRQVLFLSLETKFAKIPE